VAFERLGRFAEALAALEHVAGAPEHEPWLLNNRGTARLEAQPCDEATLKSLLADNLRARDLLSERKPAGFEPVLATMYGAAAELHRQLGQADEVRRCIAAAEKLGALSADVVLTQARLARDEGAAEEARTLVARALELAHPESREAEKARVLSKELSPQG
jgi:tetratricopeptide (TPR) repeat protein